MDDRTARWEKRLSIPVIVAAVATVPMVILEQTSPGAPLRTILDVADWTVWGIFAVELAVMLAVSRPRLGWARTHLLDVAIVVLTPPFLSLALQSIRVLRLLRLVRLARLGVILQRMFTLDGIRYAAALSALVWLGGAQAYALAERTSFGIGVYWALETMTTVGYGDVTPATTLGRVVACVLMLIGTGFIALVTGAIAQRFLSVDVEQAEVEIEGGEREILERIDLLQRELRSLETSVRGLARR